MKTVLCHFYNEEFLLPFWLKHHREMFDHGVMIDYSSNDRSVEIIKDLCPTWQIVPSRNIAFHSASIDQEVMDLEKNIIGWRVALNVTEFLVGDTATLDHCHEDLYVSNITMVCREDLEETSPDPEIPLCLQHTHGFDCVEGDLRWWMRRISNHPKPYYLGRHFYYQMGYTPTSDFKILWYRYAPYNEQMIERSLQIQNRIPESDKQKGFGINHFIDAEENRNVLKKYQERSEDVLCLYRHLIKLKK